jgi:hypothetical protein
VAYNQELAEVNDRVGRLAARLAALDGLAEDGLHPAVAESGASAGVAAAACDLLANRNEGRARIAAAFQKGERLSAEEARALLAQREAPVTFEARVSESEAPTKEALSPAEPGAGAAKGKAKRASEGGAGVAR